MGESNDEHTPLKRVKSSKTVCNFKANGGKLKPSSNSMSGKKQINSPTTKSEVKFEKLLQYKPIELMTKLENFSDVWNDCPVVENPKNYAKTGNRSDGFEIVSGDYQSNMNNLHKKHENIKNKCSPNGENLNKFDKHKSDIQIDTFSADSFIKLKSAKPKWNKIENYDSKLADLKRKKAVQEHRKVHVDQRNIIKQALSSLDGKAKTNKKILFTDENDTQRPDNYKSKYTKSNKQNEIKSANKLKLFNDDDDDCEPKTDLRLNHQFEGKKGQKLLELHSKFASDSRFTLDTRFYESGSEESDSEKPDIENHTEEKQKQLAILESIVKQPIRPLSDIKKKSNNTNDTLLLRFDPTREDHNKYLVKSHEPQDHEEVDNNKSKKKKTKKNVESVNKVEENKAQVSNVKFYAVKDDLKEVLQKEKGKEQFSLLKLFGSKVTENSTQQGESQRITNLKRGSKNPFKYDSSESEPEEEDKEANKVVDSKNVMTKPVASWKTTFFFGENDSRFQEAFEFLKRPEETERDQEYTEKRKILKDFIRNKYKNNNRKKGHFKKKLGGLKRKSFLKKKNSKS